MQRRTLALLAAAAVGGLMLAGAAPATAAGHLGSTYVAIGDSEAAGTGNLPYVDSECLRSQRSYPMLLGTALGTGVASSACAGASTDDVLAEQLGDLGPATQLVTITVGVNNADWQAVLLACGTGGDLACAGAVQAAGTALQSLPADIGQLLLTVRTLAPTAQIVVTGYPMLFGDVAGTCSVGAFQGTPVQFSAMQTQAINQGIAGVNQLIQLGVLGYQQLTGDPGVAYVDVTAAFDGHSLCDTGDRWISGLVSGKATSDRSFHMNAPGQQAYAAIIADAIAG